MSIIALIPAKIESTQLEKKMLKKIGGIPLIVRTFTNLLNFNIFSEVVVITDSIEISKVLDKYSIKYFISKNKHETGTDRIAEFIDNFDCEIVINIQGDEPGIDPLLIDQLITLFEDPRVEMASIASTDLQEDDLNNDNNLTDVIKYHNYSSSNTYNN